MIRRDRQNRDILNIDRNPRLRNLRIILRQHQRQTNAILAIAVHEGLITGPPAVMNAAQRMRQPLRLRLILRPDGRARFGAYILGRTIYIEEPYLKKHSAFHIVFHEKLETILSARLGSTTSHQDAENLERKLLKHPALRGIIPALPSKSSARSHRNILPARPVQPRKPNGYTTSRQLPAGQRIMHTQRAARSRFIITPDTGEKPNEDISRLEQQERIDSLLAQLLAVDSFAGSQDVEVIEQFESLLNQEVEDRLMTTLTLLKIYAASQSYDLNSREAGNLIMAAQAILTMNTDNAETNKIIKMNELETLTLLRRTIVRFINKKFDNFIELLNGSGRQAEGDSQGADDDIQKEDQTLALLVLAYAVEAKLLFGQKPRQLTNVLQSLGAAQGWQGKVLDRDLNEWVIDFARQPQADEDGEPLGGTGRILMPSTNDELRAHAEDSKNADIKNMIDDLMRAQKSFTGNKNTACRAAWG